MAKENLLKSKLNRSTRKTSTKKSKGSQIIVNAEPWETRVALIENGRIAALSVERSAEKSYVGNVYKGRVVRVLPGMQAAFVDIGLERTAFLYVAEVHDDFNNLFAGDIDDLEDEEAALKSSKFKSMQIQDMLKEGQEVLVQVAKGPIGTKGARLTCHISLPGRSLVLMPTMDHIGVSRRIADEQERRRLRDIIAKVKAKGEGLIVRTAGDGQSAKAIRDDVRYLHKLWADIQKRADSVKAPALIYSELSLALREVRDLSGQNTKQICIDDDQTYKNVVDFMRVFVPRKRHVVERFKGDQPIFDAFDLETQIAKTLEKKVWLRSGGYLIVEQTEALAAIDVNTGSYVGEKSLDETILKTNLEAVEEIVYQIRFRNIGGIIIIDFIDMDRASHREKVYKALEEALKADKARSRISKITSLGLVEMTRKRTEENLGMAMTERCGYCNGKGRIKSKTSICYELYRAIQRETLSIKEDKIFINTHPDIARLLTKDEKNNLKTLETRIEKRIIIRKNQNLHIEDFEIHA